MLVWRGFIGFSVCGMYMFAVIHLFRLDVDIVGLCCNFASLAGGGVYLFMYHIGYCLLTSFM